MAIAGKLLAQGAETLTNKFWKLNSSPILTFILEVFELTLSKIFNSANFSLIIACSE